MNTSPTSMPTIEEQAEAFKAWKRGEEVESFCDGQWLLLENHHFVNLNSVLRIKRKPSLRPWTPEEVPLGCWLRPKDKSKYPSVLVAFNAYEIDTVAHSYTYQEALDKLVYSINHGQSWHPCGTLE